MRVSPYFGIVVVDVVEIDNDEVVVGEIEVDVTTVSKFSSSLPQERAKTVSTNARNAKPNNRSCLFENFLEPFLYSMRGSVLGDTSSASTSTVEFL
jgi:hypothetical protein